MAIIEEGEGEIQLDQEEVVIFEADQAGPAVVELKERDVVKKRSRLQVIDMWGVPSNHDSYLQVDKSSKQKGSLFRKFGWLLWRRDPYLNRLEEVLRIWNAMSLILHQQLRSNQGLVVRVHKAFRRWCRQVIHH